MANNTTKGNLTTTLGGEHDARETFVAVVGIATIVVGTVGNILILLVSCTSENRRTAFAVFCVALAVTDMLNLYTGLIQNVIQAIGHVAPKTYSYYGCVFGEYSTNSLQMLTSWLIVALNLERWHAFTYPFSPERTRFKAILLLLSIIICSFSAYIGEFFVLEAAMDEQFDKEYCRFRESFEVIRLVGILIGISMKTTVPIIIFIVIISRMVYTQKERQSTVPQAQAAEEKQQAAEQNTTELPSNPEGEAASVSQFSQAEGGPSAPPQAAADNAEEGPSTPPQPASENGENLAEPVGPELLIQTDPESASVSRISRTRGSSVSASRRESVMTENPADENASAVPNNPDNESASVSQVSQAQGGPSSAPQQAAVPISPEVLNQTDPEGRTVRSLHLLILLDSALAVLIFPKYVNEIIVYQQGVPEGDSEFFIHTEFRKRALLLSFFSFFRSALTFFIYLLVSNQFRQNLGRLCRRKKTNPAADTTASSP